MQAILVDLIWTDVSIKVIPAKEYENPYFKQYNVGVGVVKKTEISLKRSILFLNN